MSNRPAATVVLLRPAETPTGVEVAAVHRSPALRFLGNFWVFPGGAADDGEGIEAAALRETQEEVGLTLEPGSLVAAGRWITPPFSPIRYDTHFFLATAPPSARLQVIPGEIDRAQWSDPAELVAAWRRDELLLAPPTRVTLEALAARPRTGSLQDWIQDAAARVGDAHPDKGEYLGAIDFIPGIRLFLVRTPTLPPATHTNCLIVGDGSELVVIDPASPYPEERAKLDKVLDELAADGQRVREVLLTHHHPDHCSGAQHLADRLGVPIAAHARTRELLADRGVQVTRDVVDGELIELPADRPGARPRRLRAILCEGHADGHLAFQEEHTGCLIVGDMVAGIGTIIIDPPEGKLGLYLESLAQLRELESPLLYPSHGPTIGDPRAYLQHYIDHRLMREGKVLSALDHGPSDIPGLLPRAYDDKPPEVYPFAARAALAHLEKLEAEGTVARDGEVWRRL